MSGEASGTERWAVAEIDHGAIAHNVGVLAAAVDTDVWAVVKADGYGHGAIPVAQTALAAGASGLCVALTQEAVELRRAGIDAPILLLSQQPESDAATIVEHELTPTVYSVDAVAALDRAGRASQPERPIGVHVKIDTGMQRVGARPDEIAPVLAAIADSATLRLAGVFTHLAVADGDSPDDLEFTEAQLDAFDAALVASGVDLDAAGGDELIVHAANSAGAIAHPRARRRMVRVGIAMYGLSPGAGLDDHELVRRLRPAMSLRARVSLVKSVAAGTGISYGLRHRFERDTVVATVPIGYADGVPRRLGTTGERSERPAGERSSGSVLIAGQRCPIVGVVTMDQLMIDVGGLEVSVGDDVTLLGTDGAESITATEWATHLDTIGYEIVCGISARVPRRHLDATGPIGAGPA